MIVKEYPYLINKTICDTIIDVADSRLETAQILGEQIDGYRTAEYCWLGDLVDTMPELQQIQEFVSKATELPIENQEHIHIVKYTIGGEYKEHYDWFYDDDEEQIRCIGDSGNRTHSFLIYLNDDFEGGDTEFIKLKQIVKPQTGKGLMWTNMKDGKCLDDSLHAGLPVTDGVKWILIVWIRENKFV